MIGMEANRRRHAADKRLAKTIDRHVAFLEKEIAAVDADIDTDVRASMARNRRLARFRSRRRPGDRANLHRQVAGLGGLDRRSSPPSSASRLSTAIPAPGAAIE